MSTIEPTQTAEEFAVGYAQRSDMSLAEFNRTYTVLLCFCTDYEGCTGWQAARKGSDRELDAMADVIRMYADLLGD